MRVCAIGLLACLVVACDSGITAPTNPTTVTTPAVHEPPVPPPSVAPTPAPAPIPTPAIPATVEVVPCSVIQPPAPGSRRVLLCVTYHDGDEIEPVSGASVFFGGIDQGLTDANGQFLLNIRAYGGTRQVSIEYAVYSGSPARVDLPLREDVVTWAFDLGQKLR